MKCGPWFAQKNPQGQKRGRGGEKEILGKESATEKSGDQKEKTRNQYNNREKTPKATKTPTD